jgi:hypothetical protein
VRDFVFTFWMLISRSIGFDRSTTNSVSTVSVSAVRTSLSFSMGRWLSCSGRRYPHSRRCRGAIPESQNSKSDFHPLSPIPCLPSLVSRPLSPVPCLPSLVSRPLSPVPYLPSPVSCLTSSVPRPVSCFSLSSDPVNFSADRNPSMNKVIHDAALRESLLAFLAGHATVSTLLYVHPPLKSLCFAFVLRCTSFSC